MDILITPSPKHAILSWSIRKIFPFLFLLQSLRKPNLEIAVHLWWLNISREKRVVEFFLLFLHKREKEDKVKLTSSVKLFSFFPSEVMKFKILLLYFLFFFFYELLLCIQNSAPHSTLLRKADIRSLAISVFPTCPRDAVLSLMSPKRTIVWCVIGNTNQPRSICRRGHGREASYQQFP